LALALFVATLLGSRTAHADDGKSWLRSPPEGRSEGPPVFLSLWAIRTGKSSVDVGVSRPPRPFRSPIFSRDTDPFRMPIGCGMLFVRFRW
jgi:hypothetical protein